MNIRDDDLNTAEDVWPILATLINVDELLDETALAARESIHGRAAYEILRRAIGDRVPTLEGRLRLIDARSGRA